MERARTEATYGWDSTPISTARLSAEIWEVVRDKDWSLVGGAPSRLWNVDTVYRTAGGGGAAGVGYSAPGSVGAALANRKYGRFSVAIQTDGDLMYAPGALWTAAHHRIPMMSVMHNNRAYHQEVMHIQRMANRHQRGITNAGIGTTITDPNIDYATIARGMGVYGEGPITDPKDLGASAAACDGSSAARRTGLSGCSDATKVNPMRLLVVLVPFVLMAQTPNAQNGKKIFDSYGCYQCHDHDGHGGVGARLAPNPIPFATFSKYVRQPTGEMPPYTKKVVTDQELAGHLRLSAIHTAAPARKDHPPTEQVGWAILPAAAFQAASAVYCDMTIAEKILATKSGKTSRDSRRNRRSLSRPGHEPHRHLAIRQRNAKNRRHQTLRSRPPRNCPRPHLPRQNRKIRRRPTNLPQLRTQKRSARNSTTWIPASPTLS